MSGIAALGLLLLILAGMAWGIRTVLLAVLVQSAERGDVIPMSLSLARSPVPSGESFVLSLPARIAGAPLASMGSLVLTSGRVRLVQRGRVTWDVPLTQVEHLTVAGGTLRLTVRGGVRADVRADVPPHVRSSGAREATGRTGVPAQVPFAVRVAQPALLARYIRCLAVRYLSGSRASTR